MALGALHHTRRMLEIGRKASSPQQCRACEVREDTSKCERSLGVQDHVAAGAAEGRARVGVTAR